jgi:hypothetical protein
MPTIPAKESALIPIVKYQILAYKTPQIFKDNIEKPHFIIMKTLEVGKHHTMDPIMEGILSCSLASSRGKPPNEIHAPNTIILLHIPLHCLNPFI